MRFGLWKLWQKYSKIELSKWSLPTSLFTSLSSICTGNRWPRPRPWSRTSTARTASTSDSRSLRRLPPAFKTIIERTRNIRETRDQAENLRPLLVWSKLENSIQLYEIRRISPISMKTLNYYSQLDEKSDVWKKGENLIIK